MVKYREFICVGYPRQENTVRRFFSSIVKYLRETDMLLLALCVISSVYGLVLIKSTTMGSGGNEMVVQSAALIIGVVFYVVFSLIDIDIMADKPKTLIVVSLLFIATLIPWGVNTNGNRAWLRFAGIGVQPAEVVKIPFTIIIASYISSFKSRRTLDSPLSIIKLVVIFGMFFALIIVISSDLGSALVYFFILAVVMFVSGIKLRWFLVGAAAIGAIAPIAWYRFLSAEQIKRILAPYDPTIDPTGIGVTWQTTLSRLAISSGGFTGQGLFKGSMTQTGRVSQQSTDFIFSVAGEELGFVGCFLIVLLLILIIIRCINVGVKSNSSTGLLVCTGIAAMLIFQTFENIGMCLGLTPVIGLTLPFFSYGGTSIVTNFVAMGIIAGIKMRPKPLSFRNN